MSIGIPYSPCGVDAHGYYVECGLCGVRCYAEGDGGYDNDEDSSTKGAGLAYAFHYEAAHGE